MEYSIGEFAALMNMTVKALRHYEKIGLLNPVRIDQHTGYRRYDSSQFEMMMQIRQYQGLGLTLAGIKRIIVDQVDDDSYGSILRSRQSSLFERITKDLETYQALSTALGSTDSLSDYAQIHATQRIVNYMLLPAPSVRNCVRYPIEYGLDYQQECGPSDVLLSISTPLASRRAANIKRATLLLEKRILEETSNEQLKTQIWYWIETCENEGNTPFLLHAGLDFDEKLTRISGSRKIIFKETSAGFTLDYMGILPVPAWNRITKHLHHEMYEQGAIPSGPLFVRYPQDSRNLGDSITYQRGEMDESILRVINDPERLEPLANPFTHWYSDC